MALVGAVQVAAPFLLISLGELEISSALAGILVATAPIFTAVLAIWVDHEERSEGARLLGIVIGIAGVVALFGLDLSGSGAAILGGLAIVLASLGYAVGGFLVKHRLSGAPPIGIAAWVMVASTIWLLPAALATAPGSVPALGPVAAVTALRRDPFVRALTVDQKVDRQDQRHAEPDDAAGERPPHTDECLSGWLNRSQRTLEVWRQPRSRQLGQFAEAAADKARVLAECHARHGVETRRGARRARRQRAASRSVGAPPVS